MRVKLGKDTPEFRLFMDFWNMMQEIWGIEETDEYRDNAAKRIDHFLETHNSLFAEELVGCLLNELNRRKKVQGNEGVREDTGGV